jgi:hypothetical protein
VPLAVPLLVGALERATHLAESITARGLTPAGPPPAPARTAILGGLAGLTAGWLGVVTGRLATTLGIVVAGAGLGLATATVLVLERRAPFRAYRRTPWRLTDTAVSLAAWLPPVLAWLQRGPESVLAYSPYPALTLPHLDVWLAISLAGLAVPALVIRRSRR